MGDVHLWPLVDYQIVPNPHLRDLLDHAQLEKLSNNNKIIFSLLNLIIEKVTGQDTSDIWFSPGPQSTSQLHGYEGPRLLLKELTTAREVLDEVHFKLLHKSLEINGQFAHRENVLLFRIEHINIHFVINVCIVLSGVLIQ